MSEKAFIFKQVIQIVKAPSRNRENATTVKAINLCFLLK